MADRNNYHVINGVPHICRADHHRSEDCVWEPLIGTHSDQPMTREAIQQGWRDYDAAIAAGMNPPVVHIVEPFEVSGEWRGNTFHPTDCTCGEHDKPISAIDLYDTPIDLRPVPKADPIDAAIAHLHDNGDYYGVTLLKGFQRERDAEEDAENSQRPR